MMADNPSNEMGAGTGTGTGTGAGTGDTSTVGGLADPEPDNTGKTSFSGEVLLFLATAFSFALSFQYPSRLLILPTSRHLVHILNARSVFSFPHLLHLGIKHLRHNPAPLTLGSTTQEVHISSSNTLIGT